MPAQFLRDLGAVHIGHAERFPLAICAITGVFRPMFRAPSVIVIIIAVARRALDDLVELATSEPHPPALRTEVNFDSLAVSDHQIGLAPVARTRRQLSRRQARTR
jgi:hypothetical protein